MPATSHTVLSATQIANASLAVRMVLKDLTRMYPNRYRLVRMVGAQASMMSQMALEQRLVEWPLQDNAAHVLTVTNAAGTGTTITVSTAEAATVREGEQLQTTDDLYPEQMTVTGVSGGTLTVVRATSGDSAVSLGIGDKLRRLSTALAWGQDRIRETGTVPTLLSNPVQQLGHLTGITHELPEFKHYVIGDPQRYQNSEGMDEALMGLERVLHLSFKGGSLLNAGQAGGGTYGRSVLNGLAGFHRDANVAGAANEYDAQGALLWRDFDLFMADRKKLTSDGEYWIFGSSAVHVELNGFGWDKHRADHMGKKEYGLDFTRYRGTGWAGDFIECDTYDVAPWDNVMVFVPKRMMVLLLGSEGLFKLFPGVTGPGKDGSLIIRDLFLALVGFVVKNPNALCRVIRVRS